VFISVIYNLGWVGLPGVYAVEQENEILGFGFEN